MLWHKGYGFYNERPNYDIFEFQFQEESKKKEQHGNSIKIIPKFSKGPSQPESQVPATKPESSNGKLSVTSLSKSMR